MAHSAIVLCSLPNIRKLLDDAFQKLAHSFVSLSTTMSHFPVHTSRMLMVEHGIVVQWIVFSTETNFIQQSNKDNCSCVTNFESLGMGFCNKPNKCTVVLDVFNPCA